MSDEIEWGPWIEHDGKGCPCVGQMTQAIWNDGDPTPDVPSIATGNPQVWVWKFEPWWPKVIRYRIRKPRSAAVDRLAEIVANPYTPITAPEGPTREKVPASNTRDRA